MDIVHLIHNWSMGAPIAEISFMQALFFSLFFTLFFVTVRILILRDENLKSNKAKLEFISSMAIMGPTISLIMVLVGKDLANAFALLGIMSIIRFRNPSKGAGDVIYYLVAVTIGMTCGKQYYLMAGIFCVFCSLVLIGIRIFGLILNVNKKNKPQNNIKNKE